MLETSLCHAAAAPQIWWGVSVENRRDGLPRIDDLRKSPAVTRFLSVEPLLEDLGPLDLTGIHWVIVGGESGAGFRPIDGNWITAIRDQCRTSRCLVLLQTMGWCAQDESRPVTRRTNLR